MIRPPFTPSEAGRVAICTAAGVLPRVSWTTPAAELGTARHRFLERVPAVGRDAALAEIADGGTRAVCAGLDLEAIADLLDARAFVAELAIAWDFETGTARELGRGEGRKYGDITVTEIPMTVDAVALVGDDGAVVLDWKPEWGHQPRAERHPQVRIPALGVARLFNREWVKGMIVRPSDDGAWRSSATFDAFDLAAIAEETRALALRVVGARLASEQGEPPPMTLHAGCDRCPSLSFCPAHVEGIGAIAAKNPEQALAVFKAGALTPEARTAAYHTLKAYDAARDMMWETLRALAIAEGGIRVDDEQVWGPVSVNRKDINGSVAWTVLRDLYGVEDANKAADIKVTEAAIKRLIEEKLPNPKRGERSAALAAVLEELANRNGLKRYQRDEVRVHRAKEE